VSTWSTAIDKCWKKISFRIALIKTLVYVYDNRMDDACQDQ
jgi:hypothetical protein